MRNKTPPFEALEPSEELMNNPHDDKSLALRDRGGLKIIVPTRDRPIAFCDGADEDEIDWVLGARLGAGLGAGLGARYILRIHFVAPD